MGTLLKFISSSSILGLIDDILSGITTVLIGPLLWGLCDIFFLILDMFETLYKKFAGIEDFMIEKETVSQDPVLYMMNTSVVQEIFFSILILSLILLIIFTIFAIVKNIYTEKPKPVGEIIRSSMKGLLMYLLVPVATVVCLLVGNIVLRAIDGATKLGGASGMSDMLFMSAAYNANRFRDDDTEYAMKQLQSMLKDGELTPVNYEENKGNERVQSYVKIMESYGVDVANKEIENTSLIDLEGIASAVDEAYVANVIGGNKWNLFNVMQYYYIIKINLIMVWAGGAFMIFALGKITWGLVARLFKMTAYYAISPALMAMYPIDNGKAIGSWRSEMVKNGTMAYCAIGTLNVVLSILPAFSKLKLFGVGLLDGLAVLFIDIVALASAEKMISTVSSWFGTGDALAEGKAAQADVKKAGGAVAKGAKKASGMFAGMAGGIKTAKENGGSAFAGALSGLTSQTKFGKMRQDTQKAFQDASKQGGDMYKNFKTTTWYGKEDKDKAAQFEARERIDKEKKEIGVKVAMADQVKTNQIAELDDKLAKGEISLTQYKEQVKELNDYWDKAKEKIQSSASYLKDLFALDEEKLAAQTKQRDKKQEAMQPLSQYGAALSQRDALIDAYMGSLTGDARKKVTRDMVAENWEDLSSGKGVKGITNIKGGRPHWFNQHGEELRAANSALQGAEDSLINYIRSGGGQDVSKLIGEQNYQQMVSGDVGKETLNHTSDILKNFANVLNVAQENINAFTRGIKESEKALENKKNERATNGLSAKDIETIAKNHKK